jgi:hypothetical protein
VQTGKIITMGNPVSGSGQMAQWVEIQRYTVSESAHLYLIGDCSNFKQTTLISTILVFPGISVLVAMIVNYKKYVGWRATHMLRVASEDTGFSPPHILRTIFFSQSTLPISLPADASGFVTVHPIRPLSFSA